MKNRKGSDTSLLELFKFMDLHTSKITGIPPYMRRFEKMVSTYRQTKLLKSIPISQCTDSYLGAPVQKGNDFLGITFDMTPSPDYIPVSEDEILARQELNCTKKVTTGKRFEWELQEVRRHGTFHNCHEILYFPMLYGRHHFETDFAKYLWLVRSCRAKPDMTYILQLKRSLIRAAQRFKRLQNQLTINGLLLNDSIYCLNWLSHQPRQQIIKILADTFREQKEVIWISAENTELGLDDGLRLLLAISVPAGLTLATLHLWHFFREGVLPIRYNEDDIRGEIHVSQKIEISEISIKYLYYLFITRANYSIPAQLTQLVLHTSFSCLQYLEELSVEYRYLAGGKGESLLYLGCIKNGSLRTLNILFTESDLYENTKRYICPTAWKRAVQKCPHFRVNFVTLRMGSYSELLDVLVQYMPLAGFHTATGFKCDEIPLYFEIVTDTLIRHYKRFLKRLTFHMIRPRLRVDLCLSKLLTELPFLEEFVYQGPIDSVTSLYSFFRYIENYTLRLTKFHIYLTEDPCEPEPYKKKMNEIYNQYEPIFIDKGIDFRLETCQC